MHAEYSRNKKIKNKNGKNGANDFKNHLNLSLS